MPCERSRRRSAASAASRVVTMPPSAVVTIFTAWKLNTLASAQALPTGAPR
jgi:hypothetical protein